MPFKNVLYTVFWTLLLHGDPQDIVEQAELPSGLGVVNPTLKLRLVMTEVAQSNDSDLYFAISKGL